MTSTSSTTTLLDQGFAWTAARLAAVPADGLDRPTPCDGWDLAQLLDHTITSMAMLTGAVAGPADDLGGDPQHALATLAARSRVAWEAPGVAERTYELPIGTMTGTWLRSASLLEVVVHGWDISQATGERAAVPDALAEPILAFAREAITDDQRGDAFAADLGTGDGTAERLLAYLGRRPR
jgi:uncharacterized protein (TIGR03086 family)